MPNYRRAFVPGGCWFFTANLLERRGNLLVDNIDALRAAIAWTRRRYPFRIDAFVVLPDCRPVMPIFPDAGNSSSPDLPAPFPSTNV